MLRMLKMPMSNDFIDWFEKILIKIKFVIILKDTLDRLI